MRWLAVVAFFLPVLAWCAEDELDTALARLSSPDRSVRQATAAKWEEYRMLYANRFGAELRGATSAEDREAICAKYRQQEKVWGCGRFLPTAVEAVADPSLDSVRRFLMERYKEFPETIEPDPEDVLRGGCGSYDRSPEFAMEYVVEKRAEAIRQVMADPNLPFRGELLIELARLRKPEERATAMQFLRSRSAGLRADGIYALMQYPAEAWESRVMGMVGDPSPTVRIAVARALERVNPERGEPILLELLRDRYRMVAESANFSLRDSKSAVVARAYAQLLVQRPHWSFVVYGVEGHPSREAVGPLIAYWNANTDELYGVPAALMASDPIAGRKFLLAATRDPEPARRCAALYGLAEVIGDAVDDALLAALSDRELEVVSVALDIVRERKPEGAVPVLREMLKTKRYEDLEQVTRTLRACLGMPEED